MARTKETGVILPYNPWNHDAEPGDIMVANYSDVFRAWRLYSTPGRSARGELSMREIKNPLRLK